MKELLGNSTFIALVGTLFGGAGLKIIEKWMGRNKYIQEQGNAMREELRKEIEGLRKQLNKASVEEQRLEAQIDRWRGLYYDLRDEKQAVVTELTIVMERLKALEKSAEK